MNLQAEKLRLIEWLAQTEDVQFVSRIVDMLKERRAAEVQAELKPMSMGELKARVAASEADIAAGRIHDIDEVLENLG